MKHEVARINERIAWCREEIRNRTEQIRKLEELRSTHYRPGALATGENADLPFVLLTEREKNRLLTMPVEGDCEFCGKERSVRKGKKYCICLECRHIQS